MKFIAKNTDKRKGSIIEQILRSRGIEDVDSFLHPRIEHLHDPFLFSQMRKTIERIKKAIQEKENISVFADYDVDGTSSCAILILALRKAGAKVSAYIPHRSEGYGLSKLGIDHLKKHKGTSLLITVDCGITSVSEVEYAKSLGIDTIITDHHEPPEVLPDAYAILDAKIKGETYPFKELCGAGVAFKIVQALLGLWDAMEYIDIASLATVADVVPLIGENRTIAYFGLDKINKNPNVGLHELIKVFSVEGKVNSFHYGFSLGPAINAAGRMDHAQNATMLMIASTPEKAKDTAQKLFNLNKERKEVQNNIFEEAKKIIEFAPSERIQIVYGEGWAKGVIGIVASKLVDLFYTPSIVFNYDKNKKRFTGSARSIEGINIYEVLKSLSGYMEKFGGHEQAAGMTIPEKNFPLFKAAIEKQMSLLPEELFQRKIYYDDQILIEDIDFDFLEDLSKMEPFGMGNEKPSFLLQGSLKDVRIIGKDGNHFNCNISDGEHLLRGVAFSQQPPEENLWANMNLLGYPVVNLYNGKRDITFHIKDYERAEKELPGTRVTKDKGTEKSREPVKPDKSKKGEPKDPKREYPDLASLGIDKKKEKQLQAKKIYSPEDLLEYLPQKYEDYTRPTTIDQMQSGQKYAVIGKCLSKKIAKGRSLYCSFLDSKGNHFGAMFFGQAHLNERFQVNQVYILCGLYRINADDGRVYKTINPEYFSANIGDGKRIIPIYPKIRGMSKEYLQKSIKNAITSFSEKPLFEKSLEEKFSLVSKKQMYTGFHFPVNSTEIEAAEKRKRFENFFEFSFYMNQLKPKGDTVSYFPVSSCKIWEEVKNRLPFELTKDQKDTIASMYHQMKEGKTLNSLVQGDVGSGKTIVAFLMMLLGKEAGFQSCMLAPTSILAKQHYDKLVDLVGDKISVVYLSGSLKAKEKKEALKKIKEGADIVIGTHAVIQDQVEFQNLGLLIVDEQHRFGVEQREKLVDKEKPPHTIIMSATPIPRTLSIALFGDIAQVHNIKTKPAGRKEIQTFKMQKDSQINEFLLKEIQAGRQAYVVCPFIEESESDQFSEVRSVEKELISLEKYFKDHKGVEIASITGKMKQSEIDAQIERFRLGEVQILLSTTIVEVGVDVPNASVIVLKSSERFGLAQAHQLRGRVGRGSYQSYCILQMDYEDEKADILCATSDGFEVAEKDLLMRGSGSFIGTEQSGQNKKIMEILHHEDEYRLVEQEVQEILQNPKRMVYYKEFFQSTVPVM